MSNSKKGSCLCGQVQFEVKGDFENFILCHCKYCQKDTGSAHGANLFSKQASLNWITGEDLVNNFMLKATMHSKSFCKNCGSALPNVQMQGGYLVVPAGSLDVEIDIKPVAHIFMASKAIWEDDLQSISKFEKYPD